VAERDREADTSKGRIKRLYDRLAAILRGLRPDRRKAFDEYLDEQKENDNGGSLADRDQGQR
jgi:hypothetical protein